MCFCVHPHAFDFFVFIVIHQIKVGVNRVEWHDISEVYIISETTGSRLAQKIGISGKHWF